MALTAVWKLSYATEDGLLPRVCEKSGLASAPDDVILEAARSEDRACVTLDRDFHMLLAESRASRPSVIFIRERRVNHIDAADLIWRLAVQFGDELVRGVAITATWRSVRLRRLPLKRM